MIKGQYVEIVSRANRTRGKIGQVCDLDDPEFIGVRVPNIRQATETIYVTRESIRACEAKPLTWKARRS